MKSPCLVFRLLIAATAWARPERPYVFSVDINGTKVPLSAKVLDTSTNTALFCWGDPKLQPIEFKLNNSMATSTFGEGCSAPSQESPYGCTAGFHHTFLAYGPQVEDRKFGLDKKNLIVSHQFFSCELPRSELSLITTYGKFYPSCFEVEIYILPYNTNTGEVISKSHATDIKPHVPSVFNNFPLAFFSSRSRDDFVPLSFVQITDDGLRLKALACNQRFDPVRYILVENYAIAAKRTTGFVSLHNDFLVFGSAVAPTPLVLDQRMKVLNADFSSCKMSESSSIYCIVDRSSSLFTKNCFDVDVYLLPYDAERKRVLQGWPL